MTSSAGLHAPPRSAARTAPAGRQLEVRAAVAAALLLAVAASVLGVLLLAGCGNADPFSGLYWEPSTARRVEIREDGDVYWLYYGVGKQPYRATRDGDQLRISEPLGGQTIVRPGEAEGTLTLETGGKTTLLKPLPQHQ